jgi:hypothetical protein
LPLGNFFSLHVSNYRQVRGWLCGWPRQKWSQATSPPFGLEHHSLDSLTLIQFPVRQLSVSLRFCDGIVYSCLMQQSGRDGSLTQWYWVCSLFSATSPASWFMRRQGCCLGITRCAKKLTLRHWSAPTWRLSRWLWWLASSYIWLSLSLPRWSALFLQLTLPTTCLRSYLGEPMASR